MKLKEYLEKKNMTQTEFAELVGVQKAVVGFWVEEYSSPRLLHAMRVVKITKKAVKLEDLLSNKDKVKYGMVYAS